MSPRELSDAQLDALLGQVSSPPAPASGLAEQIAIRAAASPQRSANRFMATPRHRRRRPFVWTTIIAANALAAAAAASSWDGQRFDFHRLADLPHRVVAAIHLPHHHPREPERSEQKRPAPHVRVPVPVPAVRPAQLPKAQQISVPVTASFGMKTPASSLQQHRHVAVAIAGRPSGWLPRRDGLGKIKTVHRVARMQALGRQAVQYPQRTKPAQALQPEVKQTLPIERPTIRQQATVQPEIGDNRRFGAGYGNQWRSYAARPRANRRWAGPDQQRRWPKWRRNFRPPHRNQGRRFARRF